MVESTQNPEPTDQQEDLQAPSTKPCATPNCSKVATMQCPTCIKMELEPTYFCGQECFAGFWKFHKMTHKKPEEKKESASTLVHLDLTPTASKATVQFQTISKNPTTLRQESLRCPQTP
jgi:hypothetical protein